jgi:hypothetical protein
MMLAPPHDALVTDDITAGFTVKLKLFIDVLGAVRGLLANSNSSRNTLCRSSSRGGGLFLLVFFHNLQEVVDVKGRLEPRHTSIWNGRDPSTGWTGKGEFSLLVSNHQTHQTLLTVDMEALKQLGVSVGVQTDRTIHLVF